MKKMSFWLLISLILTGCAHMSQLQADFQEKPWQTCSKVGTFAGSSAGLALGFPFASSVLMAGVNSSVGCFNWVSRVDTDDPVAQASAQ